MFGPKALGVLLSMLMLVGTLSYHLQAASMFVMKNFRPQVVYKLATCFFVFFLN